MTADYTDTDRPEIYSPSEPGSEVPEGHVRMSRELTPEQEAQAAREMSSTDTCRPAEEPAAPMPEWHTTPEGLASHRSALDQIAKLADWLVANTGEPKASYGAVDAAINAMTELTRERDDALARVEQLDVALRNQLGRGRALQDEIDRIRAENRALKIEPSTARWEEIVAAKDQAISDWYEAAQERDALAVKIDAVQRAIEPRIRGWKPLSERYPEYFTPPGAEERARRTGWDQGVELLTQRIQAALAAPESEESLRDRWRAATVPTPAPETPPGSGRCPAPIRFRGGERWCELQPGHDGPHANGTVRWLGPLDPETAEDLNTGGTVQGDLSPAERAATEALCDKLGPTIGGFADPEPDDFADEARAVVEAVREIIAAEVLHAAADSWPVGVAGKQHLRDWAGRFGHTGARQAEGSGT